MIVVKLKKEIRNFENGVEAYVAELLRNGIQLEETLNFPTDDLTVIASVIRNYCKEQFNEECLFIPGNSNTNLSIKVKYFTDDIERLSKITKGDWIDLRAAKDMDIKAGASALIPLGVAIELPKGYEAIVAPRSSTFKNWGILQTNSIGIIDESYCGDNDQWFMPVYATRDIHIDKNSRVCQFRIVEHQPLFFINEVESLENEDRGGYGSTGTK